MQLFQDAKIGRAVRVGTAELGLTLSCKSTLLANDKSLGKLIVNHLETDGVPICLGTAATDLGIETAAGKRRCAASQWKRIWKGRRRAKRVNRLCKMNSEARKLTMTGIHPVQIYGHTAQGASNAQVDAMCRNLKLGTVLGKTQACLITTVAWFFRVKRVSQTAARVEQISEWISMWRNCNVDTRRRIRRFWRKRPHAGQKSPVAGIRLRDLSLPPFARCWKPDGSRAHRVFWQSPDGSATLDGEINEPHLPADGSIPNQFLCVRCDQKVLATRKHELWECPGNTFINHTHMKESEYLTSLAQEFWDTDQVLFARGLLPRDWLLVSELAECNEVKMWESVDFSACASNHVFFASDGSGGSRKTPQTLRQVAFGVATFDMHISNDTSFTLQQTAFLGGRVPGKQTVPRAELWEAIQILSKVDGKTNIQIPIDAKYVTRGIILRGDLEQGPNWGLVVDPFPADR